VVHRNKGNATDLYLPPSTVPSPSTIATDPRINGPPSSSDTITPFLTPPVPSRIRDPLFLHRRRRQQWQQITKGKEEGNKSS